MGNAVSPAVVVAVLGRVYLKSAGMQAEKGFVQHGSVSVYRHSQQVAVMSVRIARLLAVAHISVNLPSLVKGALLHDYFLYDWHIRDRSRKNHALYHADYAVSNAQRDFGLTERERNMIRSHMFPLSLEIPRYRESVILTVADKLCATGETAAGLYRKAKNCPPFPG